MAVRINSIGGISGSFFKKECVVSRQPHFDAGSILAITALIALVVVLFWLVMQIQFGTSTLIMTI